MSAPKTFESHLLAVLSLHCQGSNVFLVLCLALAVRAQLPHMHLQCVFLSNALQSLPPPVSSTPPEVLLHRSVATPSNTRFFSV